MPAILYRPKLTPPEEVEAIQRHFPRHDHNMVGLRDELVIGRYGLLPYYDFVEEGLRRQNSRLINSHTQHLYVADFGYYEALRDITPQTWFRLEDVPKDGGPFVVKGRTNSKKYEWNTHMYAPTFQDAVRVAARLEGDMWLGQQEPIVRSYVPLRVLEHGINGLPFANEWRLFFLGTTLLAYGFYWSIAEDRGEIDERGIALAKEAAGRLAEHVNFFAVDVAETAEGDWIVIEVNDGQMSGLSETDPDVLYRKLARELTTWPGVES